MAAGSGTRPRIREFFFRRGESDRDDRSASEAGGFNRSHLHLVPGTTRPVRGEGDVPAVSKVADQLFQAGHPPAARRSPHHLVAEPLQRARHIFAVPVTAAQDHEPPAVRLSQIGVGHHQELIVVKGVHVRAFRPMDVEDDIFIDGGPTEHPAQRSDEHARQYRSEPQ